MDVKLNQDQEEGVGSEVEGQHQGVDIETSWSDLPGDRFALHSLLLEHYRCFRSLRLSFHPRLTVLSAPNSQGKTAVLDGVAIALRLFVDTLQKKKGSLGFSKEDIQLYAGESGTMENFLPDKPTMLKATGCFRGHDLTWTRELRSATPGAKTTTKDAKELRDFALDMLETMNIKAVLKSKGVRLPKESAFPLISYYGTGRLFSKIKAGRNKQMAGSRLDAYEECLNPNSSYKAFLAWYEPLSTEAIAEQVSGISSRHSPQERLQTVSKVIEKVLEPVGWTSIRWDHVNRELVATHLDGRTLPVRLLSDGVRNMIAMAADMAFRCSQLNGMLGAEAAGLTPGIVLIDEIEMHLHPEWQQVVITTLLRAFPRVQFIITTHSPQVASSVKGESIRILHTSFSESGFTTVDEAIVSTPLNSPYGHEAGRVLVNIFGVDERPPVGKIADKLGEYFQLLRKGSKEAQEAQNILEELASLGYQLSSDEEYQATLLKRYFQNQPSLDEDHNG